MRRSGSGANCSASSSRRGEVSRPRRYRSGSDFKNLRTADNVAEAVRVTDRIVKAFQENLLREGLSSKLRLSVVILGFPEESPDEDVFLNKVYEQGAA